MKIFKITLVALIFSVNHLTAQNLSITYEVTQNATNKILSQTEVTTLYVNGLVSIYYNNHDKAIKYNEQSFIVNPDEIGKFKEVNIADDNIAYITQDLFYKDYKSDILVYNELIGKKKTIIQEEVNLIDWVVEFDSKKSILGYDCTKAIGSFRGRKYEVYFSPKLNQRGGPWKFDGLPGIILSAKSLDGYLKIDPLSISKNSQPNGLIPNIYEYQEKITWEEYKVDFKKFMLRQLKKLKSYSEEGDTGSIEITDRIEDLGIGKLSF